MSDREEIISWPPNDPVTENQDVKRERPSKKTKDKHLKWCTGSEKCFVKREGCTCLDSALCQVSKSRKKTDDTLVSREVCNRMDPSNVYTAEVAIARWWKQEGRTLYGSEVKIPQKCSAHTQLHLLLRSEPGKKFLRQELKRLTKLKPKYPYSPLLKAALATLQEKVGRFEDAIESLNKAIQCHLPGQQQNEYKWLLERVKRQCDISEIQQRNLRDMGPLTDITMPTSSQVERRDTLSLSYEEFINSYAKKSRPVIIEGLSHQITKTQWHLGHLMQLAGDCNVTLKKLNRSSVEWAKLENAEESTVGQFIRSLPNQEHCSVEDKRYLFDWSIPLNCPRLAEELIIPKYFSGDLLLKTSSGSLYKDSWPSLFIAPAGLRSELHVDAFGSNFWMAIFEGSKRWLFFDQEDIPFLYPQYANSLDPVFEVDLSNPDLHLHPLLSRTHSKECIIEPGDVLFVPAGCPHTVYNLQQSVAISSNFVDASNIELVQKELEINSFIDDRAADLLKQINDFKFQDIDEYPRNEPLNVIKCRNTEKN